MKENIARQASRTDHAGACTTLTPIEPPGVVIVFVVITFIDQGKKSFERWGAIFPQSETLNHRC
jgi:hypothetical protein